MRARRPPRLLIYGITVTGILNNTLLGPAIPDVLDEFDRGSSSAGALVAAASMPGVVVAPIIGLLADRFGRRVVLTPCLATFGVFGFAGALAPSLEVMVATRFLQGLGTAGLINLAVVLISDHWDGLERTALIGRNAAVLTLGLAVIPAVGGVITDLAGWRVALVLYGIGMPMAVVVWRVLPADRPGSAESVLEQLRSARAAVRPPVVRASLASGVVVFVLIFGGFVTTFPVHLEEVFGLSASARGALIALPAVSSALVAFNLGRIRARFAVRSVLTAAGVTFVLGFGSVALAGTLGLVAIGSMFYGLGQGVFLPALQDTVAGAAPADRRGAVLAMWVGAARLGQSIGPLLAGAALAWTTTTGVFALGVVVAALLLAGQVLGPIGRPDRPTGWAPST